MSPKPAVHQHGARSRSQRRTVKGDNLSSRGTSRSVDICVTAAEACQIVRQYSQSRACPMQAPSFQSTTNTWSPPPSPTLSSAVSRSFPSRVDSATSMYTPPQSPKLTAKERNQAANRLFAAACAGDITTIQSLLRAGTPIDCASLVPGLFDSFKPAKAGHLSPLAGAVSHGRLDAVEFLVANGASLDPTGIQSASGPLHQACKHNEIEIAQFLLDHGANVNSNNSYKTTPLMYAVKYGSFEMVSLILQNRPDLDMLSFINAAAIHWSVWPARTEITELLLECGANVNHPGTEGNTPLHCAIIRGSVSLVKLFFAYGADPLRRNDAYETPLQLAERSDEPPEILRLVRAAALARR